MDYSEATNESVEITLGGKKYRAKMLTLSDLFGYFESQIKSERIAEAQEFARELDGEDRRLFLRDAFSDIPRGSDLLAACCQRMATPQGLKELVWMSIRKEHPDVEFEVFGDGLLPGEDEDLSAISWLVSGIEREMETVIKKTEPKKKATKRKATKRKTKKKSKRSR